MFLHLLIKEELQLSKTKSIKRVQIKKKVVVQIKKKGKGHLFGGRVILFERKHCKDQSRA